jgi:hypothetical protein
MTSHEGGVAEVAAITFVVRIGEAIDGDAFGWVKAVADGKSGALGGEQIFGGKLHDDLTTEGTEFTEGRGGMDRRERTREIAKDLGGRFF